MKTDNYKRGIYYGRLWGGKKNVKEKLVAEFGKCFWCSIKVTIHKEERGKPLPDDTATLDHLKSRNVGREKGENTPKVLACRKCNEARARKEIQNNKNNNYDINRTTSI